MVTTRTGAAALHQPGPQPQPAPVSHLKDRAGEDSSRLPRGWLFLTPSFSRQLMPYWRLYISN